MFFVVWVCQKEHEVFASDPWCNRLSVKDQCPTAWVSRLNMTRPLEIPIIRIQAGENVALFFKKKPLAFKDHEKNGLPGFVV